MINEYTLNTELYRFFTDDELKEAQASLDRHVAYIKNALGDIDYSKYDLGLNLLNFCLSRDYAADPGWISPARSESNKIRGFAQLFAFYSFCEKHFDLDKSQVSRYMNIVDEFGDGENGLKDEWKAYSWSQLTELLSLTPEQRNEVKPEWTIKQIRDYKKKLVATSQHEKDQSKEIEEEIERREQQKIRDDFYSCICIPKSIDHLDYSRFDRFRCKSLFNVLTDYIELEKKYEKLKASLSEGGQNVEANAS